ncbi:MAG: dihydropyrimidinase [Pirellulales bacterium]|nr:dihydropyrimidinase [Pirellulales bacterium]
MGLLVKNGRVITATDDFLADIWCAGETITRIGPRLQEQLQPEEIAAATVIDAAGMLVFPGFIDPHVHIYLSFMGTYAKDNYQTASRAALLGGTTTLIEMICPNRQTEPLAGWEIWQKNAAEQSACDYTFHMGVTRFDPLAASQLREIVERGTASFKVFLAYKGALGIDDAELFQTLRLANELGVIVTAHCENAELIAQLQQKLLSEGKTGPEWHEPSRPEQVETLGVRHLLAFAELTGAHCYIVHTSCRGAVEAALEARAGGISVWIETLIQYLLLDKSAAERPNFEGAKYVMSPPLRDRRHQPYLWHNLANGNISTVATDHAPFDFLGQKELGRSDFTKIPNGIPSLQDRVTLLHSAGVLTGRLSYHRFVDCASTQAARLFGLYPQKGTIQPGSDADLVIYDPHQKWTISAASHASAVDYNGFEGLTVTGRPVTVTVRGELAVRDGQFVGQFGRGKYLARQPTHFS